MATVPARSPLKDPLQAKPVDHIVIENENVPFLRRPDGRVAPDPYQTPMRCRVYPTALSCYTSWNSLSTMLMFGGFMNALMNDWQVPECYDAMGMPTVAIVFALTMNAILGGSLCLWTAYLYRSRAPMQYTRIYLGRCLILTSTTQNEIFFGMTHLMDAISVLIVIVECFFL